MVESDRILARLIVRSGLPGDPDEPIRAVAAHGEQTAARLRPILSRFCVAAGLQHVASDEDGPSEACVKMVTASCALQPAAVEQAMVHADVSHTAAMLELAHARRSDRDGGIVIGAAQTVLDIIASRVANPGSARSARNVEDLARHARDLATLA